MKTKTKILKVFAIVAIFLGNSHLMAQTSSSSTQTVCVGDIEPYTLVDPVNGPPTANYSYQWSTTGGTFIGGISTGITINIDWTTIGVYTVTVVATDNSTNCQDSPIDVVVTVEDLANAPIVPNPPPICLNDANPTMTASTGGGTGNGTDFNWYADAGLTILLLANSVSYTDPTPYSIATTYNYWVTEESANGCEGSATMVTVTVTPLPTAPTLVSSPYEACFGDPTNPLMTAVGTGSNFNWYEDNLVTPGTPGTQVATNSNTYTSTEVNPATYTYYVEEVVGSCTSPQTTFTFTIHTPPAAPSIIPDPIEICEGVVPGDFTANTGGAAGTFTWYSDAALTNVITGAATCTPNQVLPGVYTYYLTETHPTTTCISPSSQATFEIFELPLQPTVSANPSAIICEGQATPTFTATADPLSIGTSDFTWYDASMTQVGIGLTYTPSQTVAGGPWTFFVTETNSATNCEGLPLSFTFEIVALPAAPTLIPNPVKICFGDANPAITPTGVSSSGVNLIWYDDALLTNQVGTGATFTAPGTVVGNAASVTTYSYWVVDQPGTCVSPALQVDLQIDPLPTPGPIWHN